MVALLRAPFTPYVWRRFAYALLAPLVGLFALGLALSGRYGAAGHLQRALVRTLLQVPLDEPRPWTAPGGHPFLHTVVSLPLSLVAFVAAKYVLLGVVLNVLDPVRLVLFVYVGSALVCGLAMLQTRLARKLLVTKGEVRTTVFV